MTEPARKTTHLTYISGGPNWAAEYEETSKEWRGHTDLIMDTVQESDILLAKYLDQHIFLSGIQVANSVYTTNASFSKTKERLNRLSQIGFFLKHYMKKGDLSRFPFYCVGPGSYPVIGKTTNYKHNFYMKHPASAVLKILSLNQLSIRMNKFCRLKIDHSEAFIFNANIEYVKRKYGDPTKNQDKIKTLKLISIRNYENDTIELVRQIYKVQDPTVIVSYSEKGFDSIIPVIQKAGNSELFRFTTDRLLSNPRQPLSHVFYKLDKHGCVNVETVKDFDDKKQ